MQNEKTYTESSSKPVNKYTTWDSFIFTLSEEHSKSALLMYVKIPIGEEFSKAGDLAVFDDKLYIVIGSARFNIPEGKAEENPNVMFRVEKVL